MAQKLLLTRHAAACHGGVRDDQRRLSKDGRRQAERLAPKIRSYIDGGIVLHSPALRAFETAEKISEGADVELVELEELYWGDEDDLIRMLPLGEVPVLVVGHAPSIPMAASMIAAGDGPDLIAMRGCPTATTYVFDVPSDLQKIGWHSVDLVDILITPK